VRRQREQNDAFAAIINPSAARLNEMRLEREEGRRRGRSGGRRVSIRGTRRGSRQSMKKRRVRTA
jgi:hypothetical protein